MKSTWRTVMGECPTAVTIVTSTDESGSPVGMVVGTFTSVSETPPLVGFLAMASSFTYGVIRRSGRFRASVLGATHEALCRHFFASSHEGRFSTDVWEYDEHGLPRLRDAIAWFDATVDRTLGVGDHDFVVGAVHGLGTGTGTHEDLPLIFLRGGYRSISRLGQVHHAPDPFSSPIEFGSPYFSLS